MFYKLLNFILVYILSIFNFVIILSPIFILVLPIWITQSEYIKSDSTLTLVLMMFFTTSCIMVFVIFLDWLFGFSSKHYITGTKEYNKLKDYEVLEEPFEDIKLRFGKPNVKLMISDSQEVNGFAVGNMKKQYIVLTKGLITTYLIKLKDKKYFLNSMRCIMGHEMSHLLNRDYLPTLLLRINEQATEFVSNIILQIFNIIINILQYIPIVGRILAVLIMNIYKAIDFIISFFYKYVILSIYKLIQLKISRQREYRCDLQSAKACGGELMADTLSALGENGYITIFSTHPKTKDRTNKVRNVKQINTVLKPQFGNKTVNFLSVLFILILPLIIYYYMDIKGLVENYNDIAEHIKFNILILKMKVNNFFNIH